MSADFFMGDFFRMLGPFDDDKGRGLVVFLPLASKAVVYIAINRSRESYSSS